MNNCHITTIINVIIHNLSTLCNYKCNYILHIIYSYKCNYILHIIYSYKCNHILHIIYSLEGVPIIINAIIYYI
jgi:hypothetical protein